MADDDEDPASSSSLKPAAKKLSQDKSTTDAEEFETFRASLNRMFAAAISTTGDAELQIAAVIDETGADSDKAAGWLADLEKKNVIMVTDDSVMQI